MKLLENKTALITGASRGIGRSHALLFAEEGAHVIFTDLKANEASDALVAELRAKGVRADFLASNAADFAQAQEVAQWVEANYGRLDILVNNAGITKDQLILRMSVEDWNAVMDVNLRSVFNYTKAFAPMMMRQRSGAIVNISSIVGLNGNAGQCNYAASKAGIIGFERHPLQRRGSGFHRDPDDAAAFRRGPQGLDEADPPAPRRPRYRRGARVPVPGQRPGGLCDRTGHQLRRRPGHQLSQP